MVWFMFGYLPFYAMANIGDILRGETIRNEKSLQNHIEGFS